MQALFHGGVPPPPPPMSQNPFFPNPNFLFPQNPNFPFPPNPNFLFPPNPNLFPQNPPFPFPQNPNIFPNNNYNNFPNHQSQTPNFNPNNTPNYIPNTQSETPNLNPSSTRIPDSKPSIERIESVVAKAHGDILADGGHVSVWEVSKAVMKELNVESWEELGVQMQQIPSLYRMIVTEGRINAFIHCFVAVLRITTLHDLDVAICYNEGVERYEKLELGPLVRHPLVMHYFSLSSDAKEILNVTTEEIISSLCEYIDIHKGSEIGIDEFLDFAAKQRSISGREKLQVRIQSFGMHATFIRQAKRLENDTLKRSLSDVGIKKWQVDEGHGDEVKEDGEINRPSNTLSQNPGSLNQPTHCPYPSADEERSRLDLRKADVGIDPSLADGSLDHKERQGVRKRKRKHENKGGNSTPRCKLPKTVIDNSDIVIKSKKEFPWLDEADYSLDENSTRMFIMFWKKACRKNSVAEVFWRMLQFYKINQRKEKAKDWFSSHPFIGLLNVAVISIARGMWDGVCNDFQDFAHGGVADKLSEMHTWHDSVEEPYKKETVVKSRNPKKAVTVDDIVQKVSTYSELDHKKLSYVELTFELKLSFLRKLCKCELWLAKQFSVKKFKSLGHGKFFSFLEKHVCFLHDALRKCLVAEIFKKPPLEVCMLEQQLVVLLSQAANGLGKDKKITEKMISPLLIRQFPLVNFVLAEKCIPKNFMDDVKKKGNISTCVLFSATLLTKKRGGKLIEKDPSGTSLGGINIGYEAKTFGSVTTKDAIKVLRGAPMLSDLISWTHWDIVFAPSLGPLVKWLLNEVKAKKLLCLVTKDGKVVRIDHKACLESFSEACLQGSSFQTAVELLSILSLYGGEKHVPLSLLKRHAREAFEVILKTNSGKIEINENNSRVCKKARVAASKFFIDCLCYLPSEFHVFAANILLPGLQFVLKDALLVILQKCKEIARRHMLHNIGLSLGIVEWINDYHLFNSSMTNDSMLSSSTSCFGVENIILKRRKIPKLPDSEPVSSMEKDETLHPNHGSAILIDQTPTNPARPGITYSRPSADWKTAPGFIFPHVNGLKLQSAKGVNDIRTAKLADHKVPNEINAGCNGTAIKKIDLTSVTARVVLPDSQGLENQNHVVGSVDLDPESDRIKSNLVFSSGGGNITCMMPNAQSLFTGRLGEQVAYNYYSAHAAKNTVTWVNQHLESGLPYDLVIEDEQKILEYVEVKATRSSNKDWFHLSLREWQFALEQGERFTITHVMLAGDDEARITMFKNPAKLCQLSKLQLAVLMPKLLEEFSTT